MEQLPRVSPLETLVLMELETLRLNRDKLSRALTTMALRGDSACAQDRFLDDLTSLHQQSSRLERLLEGMSYCGFGEERGGQRLESPQGPHAIA